MRWLEERRLLKALPTRGLKLHLGSGTIRLAGWVNIDLETPQADLHRDITKALPFPSGSAAYIYHEHVMEHITVDEAMIGLRDWRRLLEPGGVLRIATPDLDYLVERFGGDWKDQEWLRLPEYAFIETRAEMMNVAFRWWGHQYLYNFEELERRMAETGFEDVVRCELGRSAHSALTGLETRPDSMLIVEGVRR